MVLKYMKLYFTPNIYNPKSFGAKSKEMRDLDDINRKTKAEFDGVPSSSFYMMKRAKVQNDDRVPFIEKLHYDGCLNKLLIRTINLRNELEGADTIEEIMALVQKHKVANCGEMSLYLQEKLKSMGYDAKRIYLEVREFHRTMDDTPRREMNDHVFVLVNEKEDADWQEPKTWGSKAIILDPWTGIADYKDNALDKIMTHLDIDFKKEYPLFDRCFSDIECQ